MSDDTAKKSETTTSGDVSVRLDRVTLSRLVIPLLLGFVGIGGYQELRGAERTGTVAAEGIVRALKDYADDVAEEAVAKHAETPAHSGALTSREFSFYVASQEENNQAQADMIAHLIRVLERIEDRLGGGD